MFHEVSTSKDLEDLIQGATDSSLYSLDTEFHREKTYYPQLALLQIAFEGETYLIDPLAVDLKPLSSLFATDALCIMHAGSQDLEVLKLVVGSCPVNFIDTQILAGFIGFSSPSLSLLHDKFLSIEITKTDRLTDWLQRPLTDRQKAYAASDVDNLERVYLLIKEQLDEKGRFEWARQECDALLDKYKDGILRKEPILKIREARNLSGKKKAIATNIANWREAEAAERNVPVRQIISDLAITAIAQKAPKSLEALKGIRGVEKRHISGGKGDALIKAVAEAPELVDSSKTSRTADLPKSLKPAVTLINSWLAQLARNNQVDPALLSTRSDLEGFLRGDETSRLSAGWRYEMAGEHIKLLLDGKSCIAFDSEKGLVIEPRNS